MRLGTSCRCPQRSLSRCHCCSYIWREACLRYCFSLQLLLFQTFSRCLPSARYHRRALNIHLTTLFNQTKFTIETVPQFLRFRASQQGLKTVLNRLINGEALEPVLAPRHGGWCRFFGIGLELKEITQEQETSSRCHKCCLCTGRLQCPDASHDTLYDSIFLNNHRYHTNNTLLYVEWNECCDWQLCQ